MRMLAYVAVPSATVFLFGAAGGQTMEPSSVYVTPTALIQHGEYGYVAIKMHTEALPDFLRNAFQTVRHDH